MPIEKETEEKIFRAAQSVFHEKGFSGARMQEIADEAEINKSMLHYYYRSKDNLFLEVFRAGVKKALPGLFDILGSDISLGIKVERIVNFYHDLFTENHHLPSFIIYEMNQHPKRFQQFIKGMNIDLPNVFIHQVRQAAEKGEIVEISPEQYLLNIISMCMMPVIAKRMVQTVFKLNENQFHELLEERKDIIPHIIRNGLKPD